MTTAREVYDLAERMAGVTGRDAFSLIRAAAQVARSANPNRVAKTLQAGLRMYLDGTVPEWFPNIVLPLDIALRPGGEEDDWL